MALSTVLCLIALTVGAVLSEDTFSQSEVEPNRFDWFNEWEGRIMGGRDARPGQFPHQVSLRWPNGYHFCGGSIIAAQYVLSAANCFRSETSRPANVRVVTGSHRRVNDGTIYTVARILTHRGYNASTFTNDIAVVRTTTPILFNSAHVKIISLPNRALPHNTPLTLSGWGAIGWDISFPEVLQFKSTVSLSQQQCQQRLGTLGPFIYSNTICTANPFGRGACVGDSGGPLIGQDGAQYGVVSWHIECGFGFPDVYASVFHHLQWIQAAIQV